MRRLLPDRAGVAWHSEAGRCVWTFAEAEAPLAAGETVETLHGVPAVIDGGKARLAATGVYRIGCG